MTATVATLRRLYHERTGQPFPGGDGVVAMLAQHYGGWREPAGEVVTAMVQWAAAMGPISHRHRLPRDRAISL